MIIKNILDKIKETLINFKSVDGILFVGIGAAGLLLAASGLFPYICFSAMLYGVYKISTK